MGDKVLRELVGGPHDGGTVATLPFVTRLEFYLLATCGTLLGTYVLVEGKFCWKGYEKLMDAQSP